MAIKSSSNKKEDRIVSPSETQKDISTNILRPKFLDDYVWQSSIKSHLKVSIKSAKIRKAPLEHILFYGPPGLGKTTLSNILASEMEANIKITSWPAIEKQSDLVSLLSNIEENNILFIDEIHRLRPQVEEILYTAMEDNNIDIMLGKWTWAQSVKIPIPSFTLIWATTKLSKLSSPLRDRFWNIMKLDFYSEEEIAIIVWKNSKTLDLSLENDAIKFISSRSRKTPRIANRLLKIVRDYSIVWEDINKLSSLEKIFKNIEIWDLWLDKLDLKVLETIYYNHNGWPVWLNTLASATGEEESTIEDVVEPYLLQVWFLERSPRWRKISMEGIKYILGLNKK